MRFRTLSNDEDELAKVVDIVGDSVTIDANNN